VLSNHFDEKTVFQYFGRAGSVIDLARCS